MGHLLRMLDPHLFQPVVDRPGVQGSGRRPGRHSQTVFAEALVAASAQNMSATQTTSAAEPFERINAPILGDAPKEAIVPPQRYSTRSSMSSGGRLD